MEQVLLIVNARAGSVSARTKEVIVKALAADFKLELADTNARNHATELARDAVDRGFDAVLAFGGDGTINEVAQPLVGTDVALGFLPGGSTNVMARSLGVPVDPVEATAYVAAHLRSGTRRRINVGAARTGSIVRYFMFSAGMGLDAEVVKRVEADPKRTRTNHETIFFKHALATGFNDVRGADPRISLAVGDEEPQRLLFVVCCNASPFTYFKRWPVDACPKATLDGGLDLLGLTKVRAVTIPRIVWGLFVSRSHTRWRTTRYWHDVDGGVVLPDSPMPFQVDGDYVGEWGDTSLACERAALDILV